MFIFKDGDRIILSSPTDIEQHVRHFYSCLYEFDNACSPNDLIGKVIPSLVSEDDNASLTHLPSGDEIRAAVFSMNVAGAPGPNDFGGSFYQKFWYIVGPDMCNLVSQFFTYGWLPPNLNFNLVMLILKSPNAGRV